MRPRPPVLVSAHRCGAGSDRELENTLTALDGALALGVDFVEFDVQRCADGTFVLHHDDHLVVDGEQVALSEVSYDVLVGAAGHLLRYDEVLVALRGRARAHIDLKFTSPAGLYERAASTYEVAATAQAVEVLGADQLIVTTLDDRAVRAVRDWSDTLDEEVLVGLSLGRGLRGLPWHRQLGIRLSELRPHLRYRASRANLVVAKHTLARLGVAAFARRRGLPLLVWTVDTESSLRYWM
ncbi:MAG: hypothetical protein F2667_08385, partial [Actinobacteria bacterium]|nr:hypothetical protein [Actinomycetota bacterium]